MGKFQSYIFNFATIKAVKRLTNIFSNVLVVYLFIILTFDIIVLPQHVLIYLYCRYTLVLLSRNEI